MPPTPWQTEILASGIWARAVPRIWRRPFGHAGMHVGEAAAIGVERQFAAGGGVALSDETAGLAARHKAQIFESVDRQMRESVVDHQIVHIFVMPGSAKALGPATRNAREEVKSSIWLTIGVSTLSPVPMR